MHAQAPAMTSHLLPDRVNAMTLKGTLEPEPEAEFDIARQLGLRSRELAKSRAGFGRGDAAQPMPVGNIGRRAAEFQRLSLAAKPENSAERDILVLLPWIPQAWDDGAQITENPVRRLKECRWVQIRTTWGRGIPVGVDQWHSRIQAATGNSGAVQILAAAYSKRGAALVD